MMNWESVPTDYQRLTQCCFNGSSLRFLVSRQGYASQSILEQVLSYVVSSFVIHIHCVSSAVLSLACFISRVKPHAKQHNSWHDIDSWHNRLINWQEKRDIFHIKFQFLCTPVKHDSYAKFSITEVKLIQKVPRQSNSTLELYNIAYV